MSTTETVDPRIEERAQQRATALEQQRLEQLRAEAAAEIAQEEAEAERQREITQFTTELPEWLNSAAIEKAEQKMIAAIEAYVAAVRQREVAIGEAGAFVSQYECGRATADGIEMAGQTYRVVDPQQGIASAARLAMAQHYPRTWLQFDRY
jgi:hypothetical protein